MRRTCWAIQRPGGVSKRRGPRNSGSTMALFCSFWAFCFAPTGSEELAAGSVELAAASAELVAGSARFVFAR
eukprot:795946-Alexandrium_andersonii.AAC.1